MNIENAKKFLGQLERLDPAKLRMPYVIIHSLDDLAGRGGPKDYDYNCGTTACAAGWCSILNGGPTKTQIGGNAYESREDDALAWSKAWLGFNTEESNYLFMGFGQWANHANGDYYSLDEVTHAMVVEELGKMIARAWRGEYSIRDQERDYPDDEPFERDYPDDEPDYEFDSMGIETDAIEDTSEVLEGEAWNARRTDGKD